MRHRVTLALLVSVCTFLPVAPLAAQTKPAGEQDDVVRITTNLVQIDAVVTKDGKPVRDLKAEDFEIYQDGKKQTITTFAYISNVSSDSSSPADKSSVTVPGGPIKRDVARRTIAIVVDDLGLSFESIHHIRRQLRKFIAEELQPNDLVAVIRTGGEMGALQQFTNDKRLLNRAVEQIRWNLCSRVGISPLPRIGDTGVGACDFLGSARTMNSLRFILDSMGRLPGRKSMILMSDAIPIREDQEIVGGDESTAMTVDPYERDNSDGLQRIAEKAIRSSVVIYSVDTQGLQYTGLTAADSPRGIRPIGPQVNSLLSQRSRLLYERRAGGELISRQTGGFQIRNSNDFQLDRILEDQRGYYLIGYRPTEDTFNRQFHQIKAKVKRSGMTLRTRAGFYGITEEDANRARLTATDETNLALTSPFEAPDLELDLTSFFANGKTEGSIVRSFINLKAADLTFMPVNGRRETSVEIHGIIFGNNGAIVEQVKQGAVLSLRESEYEQALREGVRLRFDMPAKKPGSYQVRVAVRDRTSSKIGSAGQFVAVPNLNNKKVALSGLVLRNAGKPATQSTAMANPFGKRFALNTDLHFAFLIYNATIDQATRLPNLTMETKLFRDGKSVKDAQTSIDVKNHADLSRLFINGAIRLSPDLEPGDYYLQVVITDKAARDKQPPITQWVDFQIVK